MTVTTPPGAVDFRPSRVEGAADVDEVRVHRDRLELRSAGNWLTFRFLSFARGRDVASGRVPVGELHFSPSHYPDSHFVFYTTPRIVIYMPANGPTASPHSHFYRVLQRISEDGFLLYDEWDAKSPKKLLDPRPGPTAVYVLAVLAFAWLYGLSGFLPGRAGEVARSFLLSNPRNPDIGLAFMLPATAVPILLAFRHGRTLAHCVPLIALCYVLAVASEWALRRAIHAWAPLEQPPFNERFWSAHALKTLGITVTAAALVAFSWRRSYLEPIPESARSESAAPEA